MNKMNLKELSECPVLENGTPIKAKVKDDIFEGIIVGKGPAGPNPIYLVECTDGYIPNDVYQYKTCGMPLSEMILD